MGLLHGHGWIPRLLIHVVRMLLVRRRVWGLSMEKKSDNNQKKGKD